MFLNVELMTAKSMQC